MTSILCCLTTLSVRCRSDTGLPSGVMATEDPLDGGSLDVDIALTCPASEWRLYEDDMDDVDDADEVDDLNTCLPSALGRVAEPPTADVLTFSDE